MNVRHILLTSDLSSESFQPCASVAALAKTLGARITVLSVVQEMKMVPHGAPMAQPIAPFDVTEDVKAAKHTLLDQARALGTDVTYETDVVTGDKTHAAICKYAQDHDVDLICMSTHGRTGFRHFALGSIAEAVLRHSPVPVLCYPQPKD